MYVCPPQTQIMHMKSNEKIYLPALEILLYEVYHSLSGSIWQILLRWRAKSDLFLGICFCNELALFYSARVADQRYVSSALLLVQTPAALTPLLLITSHYLQHGGWDSVIGVVARLLVRQWRYFGLICGRGGYFSLFQTVQTLSGAHSVSGKCVELPLTYT